MEAAQPGAVRRGGALQFDSARARTRAVARRALSPEGGLIALLIAFIALNAWWLGADTRPVDTDSGVHLNLVGIYHDLLDQGHPKVLFNRWDTYTPLVHVTGAFSAFIVGTKADTQIIVLNLIFAPMLVLGVYGAGRAAYGRKAGVLAAIFILASPLIIYLFHVFMLDAALTALAAMSIWMLLLSRRFEVLRYALLAGAFVGFGLMTKNSFPAFVAGMIAVMLIRGGWRHWRGLLLFAGGALAVAGPWYLKHWQQLVDEAQSRSGTGHVHTWYGNVPYAERFDLGNYTWYGWSLLNNQLYLPLTILFAIGLVLAARRWLRNRATDDYTPELITGGFVGYLLITQLTVDDPRYNVPCLVYVAILGAHWLPRLKKPWATVGATAVVAVFLINNVTANFGIGDAVRIKLPGAIDDPNATRQLTLVSGEGYAGLGEPDRDARIAEVFKAAHRDGVRRLGMGGDMGSHYFSWQGVGSGPMREAKLNWGADFGALQSGDMYIYRRPVTSKDPPPCTMLDGQGIYLVKADPSAAGQTYYNYPLYCPTRPYTQRYRPH